ncbi:hypothetical protein EOA50_07680 [Mesorhizobium sp. M1A.F.Ca.IN.020.30.1.1]|uniref:hypothetical protein n=1 Tax=Mesorhizobium sp. M1A.F.Ca.IN.020.30.1.1 TaxID=2496762 RepID=UPI000FD5B0FA|nr:hypothetical protein [Mesorhizobium sp. M1A.F.Ca.IN.020.30.1.1]RUV77912.1 hypothetical protein EOA50_07680 [Mesorhizobium sp. M1A.F.Ca.IN.020.30.1.1]
MAGNDTTVVEISEGDFLSSMQLAEALGDMHSLAGMFGGYRRLSRSSNPAVQTELARLRAVLEAGQKIEEQYGVGSLLKLSHPVTIKFAALRAIDPGALANAERYLQACLKGRDQNLLGV